MFNTYSVPIILWIVFAPPGHFILEIESCKLTHSFIEDIILLAEALVGFHMVVFYENLVLFPL